MTDIPSVLDLQLYRDQIRLDKEERAARQAPSPAPSLVSSSNPAVVTSSRATASQTTLKIRLHDGTTVTEIFDSNDTLGSVRLRIRAECSL